MDIIDFTLKNKLKIIYKKSESKLTSISISIDAGAIREDEKLGVAHATEHLVYKGTKNRSEKKINEDLSRIFGFQNAMTNYPYVIYYGTTLEEEFNEAIELFSDIIINPTFEEKGFFEEMDVIKEELKEWDEDLEQYTEDKLFFNSFKTRRIKYPIIGRMKDLESIKLEDILSFYNKNYKPEKTNITIVTSLGFEDVKKIVAFYFENWKLENSNEFIESKELVKEENIERNLEKCSEKEYKKSSEETLQKELEESLVNEKFVDYKEGINTVSVQIIFDLKDLSRREVNSFSIFNEYFGEGVNSVLYNKLRTENSLIYDVITTISRENEIQLYKINYNTSTENLDRSLEIISNALKDIDDFRKLNNEDITSLIKRIKMKRLLKEEKSIYLAKELSTYETMFGSYKEYLEEENLENYSINFILSIAKKVFRNKAIEIVRRKGMSK